MQAFRTQWGAAVIEEECTSLLRRRRIEMKKYGVNELRKMFLDFMESKGHLVMKSFPSVSYTHLDVTSCGSSFFCVPAAMALDATTDVMDVETQTEAGG